ncbi:hypothetical protein EVA_06538 [gut metagenome]|uniref:Uncharacterized protein n=1 Tax=gut metagenome TaxID=749906 RepID=J9GRZ1_9ZZZZ
MASLARRTCQRSSVPPGNVRIADSNQAISPAGALYVLPAS